MARRINVDDAAEKLATRLFAKHGIPLQLFKVWADNCEYQLNANPKPYMTRLSGPDECWEFPTKEVFSGRSYRIVWEFFELYVEPDTFYHVTDLAIIAL